MSRGFIRYHSTRELPKTGYMVLSHSAMLVIPRSDGLEVALELMHKIAPYMKKTEWPVICEWSHCFYVTSKIHKENKQKALEHCKQLGRFSVIDCSTGQQRMLK